MIYPLYNREGVPLALLKGNVEENLARFGGISGGGISGLGLGSIVASELNWVTCKEQVCQSVWLSCTGQTS
jgi:hypothetical protein